MACIVCGAVACKGHAPEPRHIIDLEATPMASNMWTADRRLYLDQDGKVVEADDPNRASLLVAQGGSIPLADAERYGLVTVEPQQVKAVAAPKANKAAAPAAQNKASGKE
jgi:hypothetical protein